MSIFHTENFLTFSYRKDWINILSLSRNGMVYMSSSGLDWNPLLASWTKKKKVKQDDAMKIRKLFEDNFPELYKWWSTSLNLVMEVIQVGSFKANVNWHFNIIKCQQVCVDQWMSNNFLYLRRADYKTGYQMK